MKYGSLFSGAGLGDFGYEMAGLEVAWQVENNKYCRKILDLRWPEVKKYDDIKKIKPEELEQVDLITGGFPCQPFSVAGKQYGADDDRNLWPEMFRIIKAIKPRWVVAENVPGIIPIYLDTVLADLENEGYTCWPIVFSSHSLGAPHRRERIWIISWYSNCGDGDEGTKQEMENWENSKSSRVCPNVANRIGERLEGFSGDGEDGDKPQREQEKSDGSVGAGGVCNHVDDTMRGRHGTQEEQIRARRNGFIYSNWWAIEPNVGRVVNGCPNRVDRLKALGNGQTPCSTYVIGKWIMELESSSCKSPAPNATKPLNTSAGIPEAGRR